MNNKLIETLANAYIKGISTGAEYYEPEIDLLRKQVSNGKEREEDLVIENHNLRAENEKFRSDVTYLTNAHDELFQEYDKIRVSLDETKEKLHDALEQVSRHELRDEVIFEMTVHVWNSFTSGVSWAVKLDEHNGRIALLNEVLRRTEEFLDKHDAEDFEDGFWETIDQFNEEKDSEYAKA